MITTNTDINPTTNQALTKAIDVKTKAVNQYRHDYISKTSDLIESKYNYSVVKSSKQVQIIYDEVVKQFIIRRYSRDLEIKDGNFNYKFRFDRRIFNNKKFRVQGVKTQVLYWKQMQELNPLMKIIKQGSKRYGIPLVAPSKELHRIVMYATTPKAVVRAIENTTFAVDNIKINSQALKQFIDTTTDDEHKSIAISFLKLNAVVGYIPMQWFTSVFGRKYYKGNKFINVQNAPSVVRSACFSGCVEIDIDACSNSYFKQQAIKYRIYCPSIKRSIRFKDAVRAEVATYTFGSATDDNIKKAKRALTAIGLGASLKFSNNDIAKAFRHSLQRDGTFTFEEGERFKKMPFIKSYITEFDKLHKVMMQKNKHLMKLKIKEIHIGDNLKKPLKKSSTVNYLFQQFEAQAMRTALEGFETNIRLIVHDGVYLENLNSKNVNSIVNRFNKMDLTCSVKHL